MDIETVLYETSIVHCIAFISLQYGFVMFRDRSTMILDDPDQK